MLFHAPSPSTSSLTILLLSTLPISSTAPTPPHSSNQTHTRRAQFGGVYLCRDTAWGANGGACLYHVIPPSSCFNIDRNWVPNLWGVGPDSGQVCILHGQVGCHGDETWLRAPGAQDVSKLGWQGQILSIDCRSSQ
jgi:hypothetical protein